MEDEYAGRDLNQCSNGRKAHQNDGLFIFVPTPTEILFIF